ncbi:MAG: hypothetical protein WCG10_03645 [Chlamydiota bacterium]
MNASGQGVIVYDNGAFVGRFLNRLSYQLFTVSAGVFSLNDSAIGCSASNAGPPLVSIAADGSMNVCTIVANIGLVVYDTFVGSWGYSKTVDQNVDKRSDGYNPYALAVDSSGVGFCVLSDNFSDILSAFISGSSSLVLEQVAIGTKTGPAILAGVGQHGNCVSVFNLGGQPSSWEISFSPASTQQWDPSVLSISNINATIANPPTLNVNANGLGVLAYNLTTDNNVHGRFIHTPNQTVGRDFVIGQGTNPAVDTDEFGDAFAAWINPQGYVSGAWLPVGGSAWASSSQISLLPISSGTVPAITTLNLAEGAIVYAAGNDIRCVFYQLANPDVIKHGVLINTLKYNNDHRQKGIQ